MLTPYYRNELLDRRCREKRVTGALISHNTTISEWRFSKILNGRAEATEKEKKIIAQALSCAVSDIFPE